MNYDDSAVHLSSTSYHVLHIVGVTRAVNVSVVTLSGLILNVCSINSNTTLLLLGCIVNLIERLNLLACTQTLVENLRNCSGQSSLTVVDMTNSTNVYMRFGTFEFFFCHNVVLFI